MGNPSIPDTPPNSGMSPIYRNRQQNQFSFVKGVRYEILQIICKEENATCCPPNLVEIAVIRCREDLGIGRISVGSKYEKNF